MRDRMNSFCRLAYFSGVKILIQDRLRAWVPQSHMIIASYTYFLGHFTEKLPHDKFQIFPLFPVFEKRNDTFAFTQL